MAVTKGTKDARRQEAVQIVKSHGDVRKIRCRCGNYAVATPDGKGGVMHKCICGKTYASTPI